MLFLLKLTFSIVCISLLMECDSQMLRKEAYYSVPKLISTSGYPIEKHRVTTDDGYILQMHRIPAGRRTARKTEPRAKGKKAVLVVHGLLGCSGDFVVMGPDRSLAYILADSGYDVWLANLRGNKYTTHMNISRNDPKFWEYSFHEHGKLDVPAMIDRVLNITQLPKIFYIGYSMGTTTFFTMASERPEYNDKIIAFMALAPAVYMDNIKGLANTLLRTIKLPQTMRERGMISATVPTSMLEFIFGTLCTVRDPQIDMCYSLIYSVVGEDYDQNDWEMTQEVMTRLQPASWRQFEHFGKIAMTGVFTKWEDGLWGEVKPYNLSRVKVPVSLLYGENDLLTDKSQILKLADQLRSTGVLEEVRPGCMWPKFNHLDFVFAKDVGSLLNKPLVKHIDRLYDKYSGS